MKRDQWRNVIHDLLRIDLSDIFVAFVFTLIALAAVPVYTYAYYGPDLTNRDVLMNQNNTGLTLLDRYNQPFFTFYQAKNRQDIPLSQMPKNIQLALVATEDKDFYAHNGFSPKSILRSIYDDLRQKELLYGGSTITQQLVKNALLNPQKNFVRKYQEIILAYEIEQRYSKDEIMEMYLNSVYFGEGAFGVEGAAQTYFNKKAQDLSLAQSAYLVGLLPAPSRFSPFAGDLEEAKKRQALVLQKMASQNYISEEQKKQAETEKLNFTPPDNPLNTQALHFALMVKDQLASQYSEEQISRSGFKVKTTIDLDWQQFTEETVKKQVKSLTPNRVSNAAAVVMDPKTGEVKALVGSLDWHNEKFGKVNVATSARQPGSSFKPIYYSEALDKGIITPTTMLRDMPTTFGKDYRPKDYDGRYRGMVTTRRALANSLNIPSVEVLSKLGVEEAINTAQKFGITTLEDPQNYGLSLALGAGEVKLVEMTGAYSVLANYGQKNDLTTVLEIKDKNNQLIYEYQPQPHQIISPGAAFLISSILSDNQTRKEIFGNTLDISRVAAVKTGTTENYKDAWTLGYTPSLAVGVWVGNNDGAPMDNIAGSLGAAPIWKALMEKFLANTPVEKFEPPKEYVESFNCRISFGREATQSASLNEYFLKGTPHPQNCLPSKPTTTLSPTLTPSKVTPTNPPLQTPTPTAIRPTTLPSPTPTTILPLNPSVNNNQPANRRGSNRGRGIIRENSFEPVFPLFWP